MKIFYLDQILNSPEKILKNQNELHEVYYTFSKKLNQGILFAFALFITMHLALFIF